MDNDSSFWEDFLNVTKGVFIVAGTILTIAYLLEGGEIEGLACNEERQGF